MTSGAIFTSLTRKSERICSPRTQRDISERDKFFKRLRQRTNSIFNTLSCNLIIPVFAFLYALTISRRCL